MTAFSKLRTTGFHADLVEKTVKRLTGGSLPDCSLFNLETSFDDESVFRHLDYVGLSGTNLVAMHVDELRTGVRWIATVVPLTQVGPIEVAQVLSRDDSAGGAADGVGDELMVHIAFGNHMTIDLDRMHCEDPDCTYEHGYSGFLKRDGLAMRFEEHPDLAQSSSADEAMDFVRLLAGSL